MSREAKQRLSRVFDRWGWRIGDRRPDVHDEEGVSAALILRFEDYLRTADGMLERTASEYADLLRTFERYIGKPITDAGGDDLRAYMTSDAATIRARRITGIIVQMFHLWGVREELWDRNGIASFRFPLLRPVVPGRTGAVL